MSLTATAVNMRSVALVNLERDKDRRYLSVLATTDVTVTLSEGEPFTIEAGNSWSPIPAPINDINFTGSGVLTADSLLLSKETLDIFNFQDGGEYTFQNGDNYDFN